MRNEPRITNHESPTTSHAPRTTSRSFVRKGVEIGGAVAVLIILILWMAGVFSGKIPPGVAEVEMQVAPADAPVALVARTVIPVIEEAAGTVQAERRTLISSRIVAAIRELRVAAGAQAEAGDVLIVLDDRELVARAAEARRAAEAAAAARARIEADFRRAQELLRTGVVSRSEFDQAESAFKVADADLERARQALQAAEVALSYTEIRAPVSGRVVDRLADPGDTALPGQPLLALYDPSALRIEVPVRESLVTQLKVGDRLQVRLGGDPSAIDGTVDEIVPQAEAGSRTFLVKVGLPKRNGIYTGMFGRVLIPAGQRERILVPQASVRRVGQLAFVDVVARDRAVARRLVTLGPTVPPDRLEVLSGLRAGETVLRRND
jgi:RND family efflux transporter MFP subunit